MPCSPTRPLIVHPAPCATRSAPVAARARSRGTSARRRSVTALLGAAFLALAAALALAPGARAADDPLDLDAHAGRVVYVDFWASWCTPCRAAFPWMNALQAELGESGLTIIGVNTGDDPDNAARFLDEVPAEFRIVMDTDGAIARAYGLRGMPTAYVHDRDGELVATHVGFNERTAAERADKLRQLVLDGQP